MPARVVCKESDLRPVVNMLSTLIPAGDKTVPLGFHISGGNMRITQRSGILYQGPVPVEYEGTFEGTYLYFDVLPMLSPGTKVTFEFDENVCTIYSAGFLITMQRGYSVVEELSGNANQAVSVNEYALDGVNKLIRLRLEKLYQKPMPIEVAGDICVIKYPNTVAQARLNPLPINTLLDSRYAELLAKFRGDMWDVTNPNAITAYTKNGSILSVPCRQCTNTFSVMELLQDMKVATRLQLGSYCEQLRIMQKLSGRVNCRVAVYSSGITTTIQRVDSNKFAASVGNADELQSVFNMPLEVWVTFMNAFKEGQVEFLTGGNKVCMRNQELIVVTCTLP